MAARIHKIRHDENTRLKIKVTQLINRLQAHIDGKVELGATQVRGIEILLRKALPDLSSVEVDHSGEISTVQELSDVALRALAASAEGAGSGKTGIGASGEGEEESPSVH